ncbi:MAG: 1-acyl-sn-glycerol-3-phosphate acyltransferase [Chitinophagaceae bacterium]|nr:1-acyl-sn-glycerol-3-phosphate acyltransferase [Chitinophagaceae bacterium]
MLYSIIKAIIKVGFYFFHGKIDINNQQLLKTKGPLLLTVNHPNALIDAIVIGLLFKQPIHFLTRGDAFNKPWKRTILTALNMIPIYRLRDGIENLHLNEYAFTKSKEILQNNGVVLIFIEGICKHTHELQPFKKGAARIALSCWKENVPVQIMPITIFYSSLHQSINTIQVQLAPPLVQHEFGFVKEEAKNYLLFNTKLQGQMKMMLANSIAQKIVFPKTNLLLSFFNCVCWPIETPLKKWVAIQTNGTVFYHSILFGVLLIVVPIYLLLLIIIFAKIISF